MARRGNGVGGPGAVAIVLSAEGWAARKVARLVEAARPGIFGWVGRYQCQGVQGLVVSRGGRSRESRTDEVVGRVRNLVFEEPRMHGYQRGTRRTAFLAEAVNEHLTTCLHGSAIRRSLPGPGFGWRPGRPTLLRRGPRAAVRPVTTARALAHSRPDVAVCYVDETPDIDFNLSLNLNHRIGSPRTSQGHQQAIPAPRRNEKTYLAGGRDAHTSEVL